MSKYATGTTVSEDNSQIEIKRVVKRYGGDLLTFGWGKDEYTAVIAFRHSGRFVRFDLQLPQSKEFKSQTGLDAERRRRWRVLILRLKARFEEVSEGLAFDEAFMPYLLLPEGGVLKDRILPLVEDAYLTGHTPVLMLGPGREEQRT